MEHVAIDWGGRESQICVRSPDGDVVDGRRVRTAKIAEYLARRPASRVIIEACTQAFSLADQALAMGHEVRVVPSTLARALGVGDRRTKTDRRDAEVLSQVSCRIDLPSVHIPSTKSREHKTICASRTTLVRSRTLLINTVRAWLRSDGRHVTSTPESFVGRVRTVIDDRPPHIEQLLNVLDTLNAQIKQADREVSSIARSDELCRRFMTVPGIGPVTAVLFKAVLDEVGRFKSAHSVQSYLGLVPGEYSSSDQQHRLGITKAGSPRLRTLLTQAAWAARRCRKITPMVLWSIEVEKRRGKHIAVVALARKLAGVLCHLGEDCPETVTAGRTVSAPQARYADCGPSTDFHSCAIDPSIEREHSIETARHSHRVVRSRSSARRRQTQTSVSVDRLDGRDLCFTRRPLHTSPTGC